MKNLIQSVLLAMAVHMITAGAQEVIYAKVGETVTIKPPGGTDLREPYVYWLFGREQEQLAWRNHMGGKGTTEAELWKSRLSWAADNSLVINNIQQEHFGTFFFKRSVNGDITSYKLLKLDVSVTPASPLLPGDSLSLTCKAETLQGYGKPKIHWLNPQGKNMGTNQRLTMTATSQHSGDWICVVTYANNKVKKSKVSVAVVDLSPAPLRPQYTSKSWPLTVPCSISAHISWAQIKAKDIHDVHWHFVPKPGSTRQRLFNLSLGDPVSWKADQNRGLRPVSGLAKGNLSLTRYRGTEEDGGDYVCALEFKNGVTLNRTVHVKVLQITSSAGIELTSGQQLNLTCSLGHPLPSDLRLKWFPPEQSSLPSLKSDRHPARLTIPEVGTGDGGKWRCELWQNGTRLTLAEITLKIEPKLSVWMLVVICSVTVIVLLVLLLIFIFCRRRHRKMRHLRHRLCQCKTPKPKGFYRT